MLMWRSLIDFIAPRACTICGQRLALTEERICNVCNWELPRTTFLRNFQNNRMAQNFWGLLPIERTYAWIEFRSGDKYANIIYDFKYHGNQHLGYWISKTAATEAAEKDFFSGIDIIVPVPLTRKRRRQRGFNQAEVIAKAIKELTNIGISTKTLRRIRFTGSQTHLDTLNRRDNVSGAFELIDGSAVKGKHVLLVDDITTTGATLNECGRVLVEAGAEKISVFTLGFTTI